jgi:hypothetical protein
MHDIGALAGLTAEVLAKQIGDIGLIIHDQNACATRRLPEGQAHTHSAAPVLVAGRVNGIAARKSGKLNENGT